MVIYTKFGLSPSKKNYFICFDGNPVKMMKNVFRSEDIGIFVSTFWSCRKNGLIRKI